LKSHGSPCHTQPQSCSKWYATSGLLPKATAIWCRVRIDYGRRVAGFRGGLREARRRAEVIRPLVESASPSSCLATAATLGLSERQTYVRIPTKPAMHSKMKPATCTDLKPAGVPI
jgi:hypothetical protein